MCYWIEEKPLLEMTLGVRKGLGVKRNENKKVEGIRELPQHQCWLNINVHTGKKIHKVRIACK